MEKKKAFYSKLKVFLKKNVYYIIMALCLIAIAAMITVTIVTKHREAPPAVNDLAPVEDPPVVVPVEPAPPVVVPVEPDPPVVVPVEPDPPVVVPVEPDVPVPVVFAMPVSNVSVSQDYCMDSLVWHPTLKKYAVHNGINFAGKDGDPVFCCYDGTVTDVKYDVLNGYTVTIKHNDEMTTTYSSLNEPGLAVGKAVKKGEKIGTMGITATAEYLEGPHVHLCLYENGKIADPNSYLASGGK